MFESFYHVCEDSCLIKYGSCKFVTLIFGSQFFKCFLNLFCETVHIGGSKGGGARDVCPFSLSNFLHFRTVVGEKNWKLLINGSVTWSILNRCGSKL